MEPPSRGVGAGYVLFAPGAVAQPGAVAIAVQEVP